MFKNLQENRPDPDSKAMRKGTICSLNPQVPYYYATAARKAETSRFSRKSTCSRLECVKIPNKTGSGKRVVEKPERDTSANAT